MTVRHAVGLAVSLATCFGAAWLGSLLTMPSIAGWYAALRKPVWTPPAWLFGPVWSALYLGMALAAWLVWRAAGWRGATLALALFALQLVLNVAWSAIFFAAHRPGWALGEVILLWLAIWATLLTFWPVSRVAAWLLAPYLAWVTFASVLNGAVWRLNR